MDHSKLKCLLKEAMREAIHEQRELIGEVIAEVIEDIALARAIEAGQQTSFVDEEEILRELRSLS